MAALHSNGQAIMFYSVIYYVLLHPSCKAVTGLATFSARIVIYLMLISPAGT